MQVSLKSITPEAEINIVEIARVSSPRQNKKEVPEKLIKYLIDNKHFSPFEHSYLTLEIVTSKAIGIQLIRHRSFTFQEFSQRYAKVTNLEDSEFRLQAETNRQSSTLKVGAIKQNGYTIEEYFATNKQKEWLQKIATNFQQTQQLYKEGLELGIAKECARMVLPMSTETTIYMTGNIRSWLSFLNIRLDNHAQKEIVDISKEIAFLFQKECPIITKATNNFNNFQGMFM